MRRRSFWIWGMFVYCCWAVLSLAAQTYPTVRELRRTFDVQAVDRSDVRLTVKSRDGNPLYELQCHSAGYTGDADFDYSGDFECRLSSVGGQNVYSTLLTEDSHQSRDWESRGRFFASDLRGACALIPEFGATRTFRLRGMILTLQITNQRFSEHGKLKSLKLIVAVRPDPESTAPIAAVVPFPATGVPVGCKLHEHFVDLTSPPGNRQPR